MTCPPQVSTVACLRCAGSVPGRKTIKPGVTAGVAAFVAGSGAAVLDEAGAEAARRAFVNWMGCALGAVHDASVRRVMQVAAALGGRTDSSVVGSDASLDPVNAALVNGTAANALDYDDMHAPTLIHPTGAVVAAALALAESRGADGRTLLAATAAGIEVECRLGAALFPAHYEAGWHITATLGTLGAASAACAVLGLDERRTRHALGIAATLAGGLRAMLTSSCKSLNIGKAASAGVTAALLAEADFDSDPDALEARFGFFHLFGQPRDDAPLNDWNACVMVREVSLKPYPCGVVIHPLIDACIALASEHDLRPDQLKAVRIAVHPRAVELANRPRPVTEIEARYSLQHAAALALARRSAGLADFDQAPVDDPSLAGLRDRMVVTGDARLNASQARVSVELADGTRLEHRVDHPSGSPERPLTEAQLERKFMELAVRAVERSAAERLYAECRHLDRLPDVNVLRRHWQHGMPSR